MATRETIIVLTVLDDEPGREWWQALGLPDPATWTSSGTFGDHVFAKPELERVLRL